MPTDDAEMDALVEQLEAAGLLESYTTSEGERWMRLTSAGERVAHQLALTPLGPGDPRWSTRHWRWLTSIEDRGRLSGPQRIWHIGLVGMVVPAWI